MATLELFAISESIAVDNKTNRVSLFEILEEITVQGFPTFLPQCVSFALFNKQGESEDKDMQAELIVTGPDGNSFPPFTANFNFRNPRHRVIQRFEGLPLNGPGELHFELKLNGEHQATHTVFVSSGNAAESKAQQ